MKNGTNLQHKEKNPTLIRKFLKIIVVLSQEGFNFSTARVKRLKIYCTHYLAYIVKVASFCYMVIFVRQ